MSSLQENLFSLAIALLSAAIGACLMVVVWPPLDPLLGREFFGNVVGGVIGAAAVLVVLGIQLYSESQKKKENEANLRRAIWIECLALRTMAGDELSWWRQEIKKSGVVVGERIFDQFDTTVIVANLNRIADLSPLAADAVLMVRAQFEILRIVAKRSRFYSEKAWDDVRALKLDLKMAEGIVRDNGAQVVAALEAAFKAAELAVRRLDPEGHFEHERRCSAAD